MDDVTLLAILHSLHKITDNINSAPSINSTAIISSISGLSGVILGLSFQLLRDFFADRKRKNNKIKLVEFEINRLLENAQLAVETSSYLLDSYPSSNPSEYLIPHATLTKCFDAYFLDIALDMDENKRESMIISYEKMKTYDEDIASIEDGSITEKNALMYRYEYLMCIATVAYRHAHNALSKTPIAWGDVDVDHEKLAEELGGKCLYLTHNRKLNF